MKRKYMELNQNELVALFLFMKENEEDLTDELYQIYNRIQKALYPLYSIQQLEELFAQYEEKKKQ